MRRAAGWSAALAGSMSLHLLASAYFSNEPAVVQIAGGSNAAIMVAGSAFDDMVLTGDVTRAADANELTPAKPDQEVLPDTKSILPDAAMTAEPAAAAAVDTPPAEAAPATTASPQVEADLLSAVSPDVAETTASMPVNTVQPDSATQHQAATTPVPQLAPSAAREQPRKPPAEPKQRAESRKKSRSGNKGQRQQNAKRGNAAQTSAATAQSQAGPASSASADGNAALSNYPGLVATKLRRALRYPREARRKRLQGETLVQFDVLRNGGISAVRIQRSSGSPVLDQAAVQTVRRAAPFPEIPAAAKRARWRFTLPISFTR